MENVHVITNHRLIFTCQWEVVVNFITYLNKIPNRKLEKPVKTVCHWEKFGLLLGSWH